MHKTKYRKTKRARPPGVKFVPREENRNFRKRFIAKSTKTLCRPRGKSYDVWCHCKIHQKSYRKKRLGSNLTQGGLLRVKRQENESPYGKSVTVTERVLCFDCYWLCWIDIAVGLLVCCLKDKTMNRLTVKV